MTQAIMRVDPLVSILVHILSSPQICVMCSSVCVCLYLFICLFAILPTHIPKYNTYFPILPMHIPNYKTYFPILPMYIPNYKTYFPILPMHIPNYKTYFPI